MVKSDNYQRLLNVISANWIQRRSLSNGSHLKQVLKSKRKEKVTNCKQPQTINIPVFGGTSRCYGTNKGARLFRADDVSLTYMPCGTTMFYNEITVIESHANTSFWACCVDFGSLVYFGIEEDDDNEKLATCIIFKYPRSVDDSKELEKKLQLQDSKIGSIPFEWKVGDTISFVVQYHSIIHEYNKQYSFVANIYNNNSKKWENVEKISYRWGRSKFLSCKSVIDKGSGDVARSASFNPWMKDDQGKWFQPKQALFDHMGSNQKFNAWTDSGNFFMRTGGDTEQHVSSGDTVKREISQQVPSRVKLIRDEFAPVLEW